MDRVELVKKIASLAEIPFSEGEIFLEMLVRKISDEIISDQQFLLPEFGSVKFRRETDTASSVVFYNEDGSDLVFYVPEQRDIINYSRYNLSIGKPVLPLSGRSGSLNFVFHPHENLHSLESKADKLFSQLSPAVGEEFYDGQVITDTFPSEVGNIPGVDTEDVEDHIFSEPEVNVLDEVLFNLPEKNEIFNVLAEDTSLLVESPADEVTELTETTLEELDEISFDSDDDIYTAGEMDAEKFFSKLEEAEKALEEESLVSDDLTEITLDDLSDTVFGEELSYEPEEEIVSEESVTEFEELISEEFVSEFKELISEKSVPESEEFLQEEDNDLDFSSLTKETEVDEDLLENYLTEEEPDAVTKELSETLGGNDISSDLIEPGITAETTDEPQSIVEEVEENKEFQAIEIEIPLEEPLELQPVVEDIDVQAIEMDIPEEEPVELLTEDYILPEAEERTTIEEEGTDSSEEVYQDIRIVSIDEELPSEIQEIPDEDVSGNDDTEEPEEENEDQETFGKLAENIEQEPAADQQTPEKEADVYFSIPDVPDSARTTSEIPFERVKSLTREFFNLTDVEQQEKMLTWEFGGDDETDKADIKSATKEYDDHSAGIQEDGFTFVKSKKSTYEWSPDSLPDIESITPYDDQGPAEEIDFKLEEDIFAADPSEEPVIEEKKSPGKVRQEAIAESRRQRVREKYVPEETSEYKREQKKSKSFIIAAGIIALFTLAVLAYYQFGPLVLSQAESKVTPVVIERNDRVPVMVESTPVESQAIPAPEAAPPVQLTTQQVNTEEIIKLSDYLYQKGNVFYVQVSSWQTKSKAEKEAERYEQKGYKSEIQTSVLRSGLWYRILIGEFASSEEAVNYLTKNN
jgi:hypothetical protein